VATVLQLSDTHLRAQPNTPADKDPDASLEATLDAIAGIRADLLLLTGDLADDGSYEGVRRLGDVVNGLSTDVLAVAGNHDELSAVRRVFGDVDTVEVGAWRVIAVETTIPGQDHGRVDVDQLVRRLDHVDDRPTMVALHHPPRSPSINAMFQLIGADELLAALAERAHVKAVVSGHLHEVFDYRNGPLQLIGAPSTYYAIEHSGDRYTLVDDGLVGAQVLTLGDDGSFACERVARSLGC
jgi:3',5'-cyclic-AMP phosphodiesterase